LRILVTGATGFVGRTLVPLLLARGHAVVAVGRRGPVVEDGLQWREADLTSPDWERVLPETADAVVALAQSRRYREFPEGARDVFTVNVDAVSRLLDWARRTGVGRFVLGSSGNVYGPAAPSPVSEDTPLDPGDHYARTRVMAEGLLRSYAPPLRGVAIRFFTIYGPGQTGMLVPDIISRVRDGRPVVLAGGTGPRLSPLFVEDAAAALTALVETEASGFSVYDSAGPTIVTLRDLATIIGEVLGRAPVFEDASGTARGVFSRATALHAQFPGLVRTDLRAGIRLTCG
jgi:UDP-glucose 4-epimerase